MPNNPGTTCPADQIFPAPPHTRSSPAVGSASVTNSSGESQFRSAPTSVTTSPTGRGLPADVHAGSASQVRHAQACATAPSAPAPTSLNSSCEAQLPAVQSTSALSTGHGLPTDVHAGSANHSHYAPTRAASLKQTATTIFADSCRPGGIPKNIVIR